jgi:protein-disulfide isomerase
VAPPPPPARKASPKIILLAAVAIVAVIAGAILAVSLSGGGSSTTTTTAAKLPGAEEVQRMFAGIPQSSNTLGAASAPVTMAEYIDLQCPYCREFETTVLPKLLTRYVRPGRLRIEQRLLAFLGPDSGRGRSNALAAGLQNKQFNFSEILYFNQGTENTGWLDQNMVLSAAASIPGLKAPQMVSDASSSQIADQAKALDAEAKGAGISSTPTILVGKTGGTLTPVPMSSPTDFQAVVLAIEGVTGGTP